MESFVEVVFLHNYLFHALALSLSCIFSKRAFSRQQFHLVVFILTSFATFLFIDFSEQMMWFVEMMLFVLFFKNKRSTYCLFMSFRFLLNLICFLLLQGSILNHQFFSFEIFPLFLMDVVVLFFYFVLYKKWKYVYQEKDFVREFILEKKKYVGYLDSGNLASIDAIPLIFIREEIYENLSGKKRNIEIVTIHEESWIEGIEKEIKLDGKKCFVLCCPMHHEYPYDALLNMKGIL